MEIVTNQLMLTGVVTEAPQFDHEVFGEAFFHTILSVPRLSGAYDLLPLTVSERLMAEGFKQGDTVSISGQLRSYNKVMGGQGRLLLTAFAQRLRPVDEEENPNTVFLTGALCKPPSFRTTPFGREIADLMLAVNRSYGKSDYIPCIAWGAHGTVRLGPQRGRPRSAAGALSEPRLPETAARRHRAGAHGLRGFGEPPDAGVRRDGRGDRA